MSLSPLEQHERALHGGLFVRADDRVALVVTGSEREAWLQGLVTADVTTLAAGGAIYSLIVEKKGRLVADLVLLRGEGSIVVLAPRAESERVFAELDHHLIMEDVELSPWNAVAFEIVGAQVPELSGVDGVRGALDLTGLGGGWVAVARADEAIAREILSRSLAEGDEQGRALVYIDRGVPRFGHEATGALYPQEAALEGLGVSFDKGCYLGQEVLYMLQNRGKVRRRVTRLVGAEGGAVVVGAALEDSAGEAAGTVLSVAHLPDRVVALALVTSGRFERGEVLRSGATELVVTPA